MSSNLLDTNSLRYVAAPMVNQSDLPFRAMVHQHGCTAMWTQMFTPTMLADPDFRALHLRDMQLGHQAGIAPTVAQIAGNDVESLVKTARELVPWVDGIDLNLGCPQDHAKEGHYGAYLLSPKDWSLLEQIVSSLSTSLPVPVSVKLRLCTPSSMTSTLAVRLAASGASLITLHARYPSARHRRHGPADLSIVKELVDDPNIRVPIISNGNVRTWDDVQNNLEYTGAAGVMVGEALLSNPCLFDSEATLSPLQICLAYTQLCEEYPTTAPIKTVQMHVRHILESSYSRKTWYKSFRTSLDHCDRVNEVEVLLEKTGKKWLGYDGVPAV